MTDSSHRLGLALVAISTLAWSTAGFFTRAAQADLATIIIWRGLFGTLGMVVVLFLFHGRAGLGQLLRLGRPGWAYVLVSLITLPAYLGSLYLTSIAHVAIIYAMVPFLTAGLAWLALRERPDRAAIIASTLALLGAVIMVGLGTEGDILGDALALVMTFGMAVLVILARKYPGIPAMPAGMLATFLTVLGTLPFATTTLPGPGQLLVLALFGLSHSLLGFTMFLIGSSRIPAVQTALIGALEAPIAPIWVWLAFGETPTVATLLGGAVVMAASIGYILCAASRPSAPA